MLDAFDGDDQLERVDALAAMKACLGTETVPAVVTVERQRWSRIVECSIERHGDGGGQSWNGYVRGALRDVLREGMAEGQSGS